MTWLPDLVTLLESGLDSRSPEAVTLLARWERLHAVRTGAGALAFLLVGLHLALAG